MAVPPPEPPAPGAAPRRLFARLRAAMARGAAPLSEVVALVAAEMVAEVCSIYVVRPGEILELAATHGLNPAAVGRTRLQVGEGIVGLVAATGTTLNLPDAQNHPAFVYRPETGEEPFASMLSVPVRRAGRLRGVLTVQNRLPRRYGELEVETVETVAMLIAEALAAAGAGEASEEGAGGAMPRRFVASTLAPGLVLGPVVVHGGVRQPARLLADDPAAELARLERAVAAMQAEIDALIEGGLPPGEAPREVLEAYRLVAADAGWLRRVREAVRGGLSAEAAIHRIAEEVHERMRRIADPHLRERGADIEDMAGRLLGSLAGETAPEPVPPGAILLARRLGPADLLAWQARGIAGLAVEEASPAGHAAILARALGLPALGGARGMTAAAEAGAPAILDADQGLLILRPESEVAEAYARAASARAARRADYALLRERPTATRDGVGVRLMLNVGLAFELDQLAATGADGIGLYRTEIAMLARGAITDVADQEAVYAGVLDRAEGRPVLFRTLDLGGDKMLPGAEVAAEENPAMGWRSIRVGLDRPALLRRQLRALLLAARGRPLSIMFPMIATAAEFRAARAILRAEEARVPRPPARLAVGCMVEVPALLFQLEALAPEADFLSVGSNDLMQFLFAADRANAQIAGRYDFLSAPVFAALERLLVAGTALGKPVSLCGEAAARPLDALALVGLGFRTLSMSASAILPVKALLAEVDLAGFAALLAEVRRADLGAGEMRETLEAWAREQGLPL